MANENLPIPEGLTRENSNADTNKTVSKAADATRRVIANLRISQKGNEKFLEQLDAVAVRLEKAQRAKETTDAELALTLKDIRKKGGDKGVEEYLKNYDKTFQQGIDTITSAFGDINRDVQELVKSENNKMSSKSRHQALKQLAVLEKMSNINESVSKRTLLVYDEHEKNKEEMRKRWKKEDEREKEKNALLKLIKGNVGDFKKALKKKYGVESDDGGKWKFGVKNALIATALTPLRSIIDPLAVILNKGKGKGIYDFLEERSDKKVKRNLEMQEEDERYNDELEKLEKDRKNEARYSVLLGLDKETESLNNVKKGFGRKRAAELLTRDEKRLSPEDEKDDLSISEREERFEKSSIVALGRNDNIESLNEKGGRKRSIKSEGGESKRVDKKKGAENISLIMKNISPDKADLLKKGGVIGAGFVFLAREMGKLNGMGNKKGKKKSKDDEDTDTNGLKKGFDFIKKNGKAIGGYAAVAGLAIASTAMIEGSAKMQKRDSEDAKEHFKKGKIGRGFETSLLGDRSRLTEENANAELGRTTGKTALAAGGVAAGIGAAAGGATIASTLAAGGGFAAAGTAALGAVGAALPPALIGAAVVTAGMVVAKGTQEAFEMGWDKNQAEIQKELTDTMLSEDSTTMEKVKAGAASVWKGFTGEIAGGIRGVSSVLDAEAMEHNERQIDYIKKQAEAGNESYARLQEILQDKQFQAMSEEEKKTTLEANGLMDEFKESNKKTRMSIGHAYKTFARSIAGWAKGIDNVKTERLRGRSTAVWKKQALKGMKDISGDDVKRLKSSDEYEKAIADGKNEKQAMQAAYLAEQRERGMATGALNSKGMVVLQKDLMLGRGKKKTDEQYRKTFEYSKKKAELMKGGMTAEEADLAAIDEQNKMYDESRELRLKRSKEYKETLKKQLKEGKSIKQAEEEGLHVAKENEKNSRSIAQVMKEKFGNVMAWWDRLTGKGEPTTPPPASSSSTPMEGKPPASTPIGSPPTTASVEDAIIQKNGKVIHLSDEDNVYATKNEPRVIRDREAQMAMPNVPHVPAEFSDVEIIAKLQELIDALNKKNMSVNVAAPQQDVNFDNFRMAVGM